jgi:hypothetical protein
MEWLKDVFFSLGMESMTRYQRAINGVGHVENV